MCTVCQWRNEGGKGEHLPPGAALWGRQIEVGMLRTNYMKCQMSADANNYNLQNLESHCEISSRSPRIAKQAIINLSRKWCFKAEFLSPGARLSLWIDSRLRHNAFRKPGLQTFRLIILQNDDFLITWLYYHDFLIILSQRFQKARVANFSTSLWFYSFATKGRESSVQSGCTVLYWACV